MQLLAQSVTLIIDVPKPLVISKRSPWSHLRRGPIHSIVSLLGLAVQSTKGLGIGDTANSGPLESPVLLPDSSFLTSDSFP